MKIPKILYLRLGAIGDIVQSAIALAAHRGAAGDLHIEWAVDSDYAYFARALGVADKVIPVRYGSLVRGRLTTRVFHLLREMFMLARQGRYSYIVNAHSDSRYKLLFLFIRKKKIISLSRSVLIQPRYRVFEYHRLLSGVGSGHVSFEKARRSIRESLLSINDEDRTSLKGKYVVLAPGGASNILSASLLRRWPTESYAELASKIKERGFEVVLVGSNADISLRDHFKNIGAKDLIGKTDLVELFHTIDKAAVAVMHDSGPSHIASITKVPLVALFGPTLANSFMSFSRPATFVFQNYNRVSCSPCYTGSGYPQCENNVCMSAISVDKVFAKVVDILNNAD